jgi:hypothetical protein
MPNSRGMISFVADGKGTRSSRLFVNKQNLDDVVGDKFPSVPIGKVVKGMEVRF